MSNPYPPNGPEDYGQGGYSPDPSAMGGQPGYGPSQPGYPPQPGYGQQSGYGPQPGQNDDNTFAMLTHLLGIITGVLGPLIMYLVKKDAASPYLRHHLLEALNFQIMITIAYVVSSVLMVVFIGLLTWMAAAICALIFGILAGVAANKGEWYRYPVSIRMVK